MFSNNGGGKTWVHELLSIVALQLKIVYSEFGIILFTGRYRKIVSTNTSRLEAHVGLFRLLMKGILGPYVL